MAFKRSLAAGIKLLSIRSQEAAFVQIAILVDTSTSMQGRLDPSRTRISNMVYAFDGAKRDGKAPNMQVALYENGRGGFRYLRQVVQLSDDLDKLSEELFKPGSKKIRHAPIISSALAFNGSTSTDRRSANHHTKPRP